MSETQVNDVNSVAFKDLGKTTRAVNRAFKYIFKLIYVAAFLSLIYWCFASDRYVSEAVVLVQNTDTGGSTQSMDLLNLFSNTTGNKSDQLLLVEYLTSLDMLNKLDKEFDLRSHYSSTDHDIVSRLWDRDVSVEWFYAYFKKRVFATYDDYTGVIRIEAQAFDPVTAEKISAFLVKEGEAFMNELTHSVANEQVVFLEEQVDTARDDLRAANDRLLKFQNQKNMASPAIEVENYQRIIADLEKQKSELIIKMQSLPQSIGSDNQIKQSLRSNIKAIDEQIANVRSFITSDKSTSLNDLADKEQALKMDVDFKKDIYSSALTGLVKGKMNAARLIKHVSVLQSPSKPEYALKPERFYCFVATLCIALLVLGMLQLLKSVILDHVD